jgi:Flp pilus assembly protein TadG
MRAARMWATLRSRWRARRGDGERGAALVEMAICTTLLITIAFGIVEFGNAWNQKLEVETATRSGARVGSSLGNDRMADYGIIQATASVLNDFGLNNVDYVVVYKVVTANGARTGPCAQNPPVSSSSASNPCNVYTGAQLGSLTQSSFTGTVATGCTGTSPDRFWCPLSRANIQSVGADYLGVYVKARYNTITGVFKSPFGLSSFAVMRLEPK